MNSKPVSVCIVIQNSQGRVLLLLRDDKPSIQFPNKWVILGGQVESNEKPETAIRREIIEEIETELGKFELFKKYEWPEKTEYCYRTTIDLNLDEINLHEGQKIEFFSKKQISGMDLAFHDNEIMNDFFVLAH